MITYHEELMRFIEPSWPMTYMIENRSNKSNNINELLLSDDLKGPPVVELGRITYKSSGVSMYIPKDVTRSLHWIKKKTLHL